MTRYLLDTNIISNATKPAASQSLLAWMAERDDEDLDITALTVAEIWRGILEKAGGRKRDRLVAWFSGPDGPPALFAGRVPPFDEKAGLVWARLMAKGRPRSARHDRRGRRRGERLHRRHRQREGFCRHRDRQSAVSLRPANAPCHADAWTPARAWVTEGVRHPDSPIEGPYH